MTKKVESITAICGSCGARYAVQANWLESAIEFHCSCEADLKADTDDLFQIRHDMMKVPEITLHPVPR
jgi:hypothetical protein